MPLAQTSQAIDINANATICRRGSRQPSDRSVQPFHRCSHGEVKISLTKPLSPRGKLAFEPRSLVAVASKNYRHISTTVAKSRASAPSRQTSTFRHNLVTRDALRGAGDHVRQHLDVTWFTTPTLPNRLVELENVTQYTKNQGRSTNDLASSISFSRSGGEENQVLCEASRVLMVSTCRPLLGDFIDELLEFSRFLLCIYTHMYFFCRCLRAYKM